MSALSPDETALCKVNPIGRRLDALRDEFLAKYPSNDLDWQRTVRSDGDTVKQLIGSLQSLPAAARLPSRHSGRTLDLDLATIVFLVGRGLDVEKTAVLLERVIKPESDHNIWCAVYDLVASAIPATPPPQPYLISPTLTRVKDTPRRTSSGAVVNSSERRKHMDAQIRQELSGRIYKDVPEFLQKIFVDRIPGLKARAEEVLEKCKLEICSLKEQKVYDGESKRWTSFPKTTEGSDVAGWLAYIIETIGKDVDKNVSPSRILHSEPNKPLPGPKAKRKPDLGFFRTDPLGFRDVLIPGELKSNPKEARQTSTCHDLARYVREIYGNQDTRRFVHGFTICGDLMTVYLFDRGAVYAAPEFSVNRNALQFVTVMLGYLLMNDEQLGFDTSVRHDGACRFMEVGEERFVLNELLFRQPAIVCRGTTCWKVTSEETGKNYVVKDSWQYEPGRDEIEILKEISAPRGMDNIAIFHAAETVKIAGLKDDLFENIRRGLEVHVGKMAEDTERASEASQNTTTSRKRSASSTADDDDSRGSVKRRKGSFEQPMNRIHTRIVMTTPGKPLHCASTRKAVLLGLIGGLSGHQQLLEKKVLHRDISIGNVLLSEDETKGFLIDLDHAIKIDRQEKSGASARTGTPVFMSIRVLDSVDGEHVHSFMDDVESMFWLLFWICIHYRKPGDEVGQRTAEYEQWNFASDRALADAKRVLAYMPESKFLKRAGKDFSAYYVPLIPWVAKLKKVIFPENQEWEEEDAGVYDRAKDVLRRAMEDPAINAEWKS